MTEGAPSGSVQLAGQHRFSQFAIFNDHGQLQKQGPFDHSSGAIRDVFAYLPSRTPGEQAAAIEACLRAFVEKFVTVNQVRIAAEHSIRWVLRLRTQTPERK